LELNILGTRWGPSGLEQLNSLKLLAINFIDDGDADIFGNLFTYLNKNVAHHKKLETFMLKFRSHSENRKQELEEEPNGKAILKFFETCSESLRTVHLEFQYLNEKFVDPEYFYEGLSKLRSLQSLTLILDFQDFNSKKKVEKLYAIIFEVKSLEKLDFIIQIKKYQEKALDLRFPLQLKKLSVGMNASNAPFNSSKPIWSLSNLSHLELEFMEFNSQKWSKILHDIIERLKLLEVLILKKTQELLSQKELQQMKDRLDVLMKESLNLKLIIFANMESEEMIIFRRKDYSWSEINPVVDDLSFDKNIKISFIKSYQERREVNLHLTE